MPRAGPPGSASTATGRSGPARPGRGRDHHGANRMTAAVQALAMLLVGVMAFLVVTNRDPARQAVAMGVFGSTLAILFLVLQAPDVALSQIVVGVAYPLMVLLTLAR